MNMRKTNAYTNRKSKSRRLKIGNQQINNLPENNCEESFFLRKITLLNKIIRVLLSIFYMCKRFLDRVRRKILLKKKLSEQTTESNALGQTEKDAITPEKSLMFNFDGESWKVFLSFVETTEKTLNIMTNSVDAQAIDLILSKIKPCVKVKIISKRIRGYKLMKKDIAKKRGITIEIVRCKEVHGKMCLRDNKAVLIGSSNLTYTSLGRPGNLRRIEANVASDDIADVAAATELFNAIFDERKPNENILKKSKSFLSSAYGFPTKIIESFKNAREEIVVIVPPLVNAEIIELIANLNAHDAKIKVIIPWPSQISREYLPGLEKVRELEKKGKVVLKAISRELHAKIFVIDQKEAFVSSVNLTWPAWNNAVEVGLLTKNTHTIETIQRMVESFSKTELYGICEKTPSPTVINVPTLEDIPVKVLAFVPEGRKIIPVLVKQQKQLSHNRRTVLRESKYIISKNLAEETEKPFVTFPQKISAQHHQEEKIYPLRHRHSSKRTYRNSYRSGISIGGPCRECGEGRILRDLHKGEAYCDNPRCGIVIESPYSPRKLVRQFF